MPIGVENLDCQPQPVTAIEYTCQGMKEIVPGSLTKWSTIQQAQYALPLHAITKRNLGESWIRMHCGFSWLVKLWFEDVYALLVSKIRSDYDIYDNLWDCPIRTWGLNHMGSSVEAALASQLLLLHTLASLTRCNSQSCRTKNLQVKLQSHPAPGSLSSLVLIATPSGATYWNFRCPATNTGIYTKWMPFYDMTTVLNS